MNVTKRSHYLPCFWTAHWNENYFFAMSKGEKTGKPREQKVFGINFRAKKILPDYVKNFFFEDLTRTVALTDKEFLTLSQTHRVVCSDLLDQDAANDEAECVFDIEDIFCKLENSPPYVELRKIITNQCLTTKEQKAAISCLIFTHKDHLPEPIRSLMSSSHVEGKRQFEAALELPSLLIKYYHVINDAIHKLCNSDWTLYASATPLFPLSDRPVLNFDDAVVIALSPRLLLKIDSTFQDTGIICAHEMSIPDSLNDAFRVNTIRSANNEIVFCEESLLSTWLNSPEAKSRVESI